MDEIINKLNPGKAKKHLATLQHPLLNSINYHHPPTPCSPLPLRDFCSVFITLGGFTGLVGGWCDLMGESERVACLIKLECGLNEVVCGLVVWFRLVKKYMTSFNDNRTQAAIK